MTYVRRDIWALQQQGGPWEPYTRYYALAIRTMQARPTSDPTSWLYQANVHGTWSPVPPGADWNQCQHASWWFLPWHRMYIFQFEAIVRAAVVALGGPQDWALPYWDYSRPWPYNTLPPALRAPTMPDGTPNPLYVPQPMRNPVPAPGINGGAQLPPTVTSTAEAMATPNFAPPPSASFGGGQLPQPAHFDSATGTLERQPHNLVHVAVGGTSNPSAPQGNWGWMTDPNMAARDPVFWLHHSNIDRLWEAWKRAGHSDTDDPAWLDQTFPFFDANREPVTMRIADVLDPGSPGSTMDYTYDDAGEAEGIEARPAAAPALAGAGGMPPGPPREIAAAGPVELGTEPTAVALQPSGPESLSSMMSERQAPGRVQLALGDLHGHGGSNFAVYLGEPDGDPSQPSERLVGTLSTFGLAHVEAHEGHEGHHHDSFANVYDITDLARRLAERGEPIEELAVTFVPLGLMAPAPEEAQESLLPPAQETFAAPPAAGDLAVQVGRVSIFVE